jgi:hypothetical protein
MNKLITIILSLSLSACATYKIVPDGKISLSESSPENITVVRENEWPEGNHCFEPMLNVLTLGIIPTHCVDTYRVSTKHQELGKVKVTSMQGWVALLMAPSPSWQYGYGSNIEAQIKKMVHVAE